MSKSETLILRDSEIRALLPHSEFNGIVEEVFRDWGLGQVVMPAKIHLDMSRSGSDAWNNAMPAFLVSQHAAGIKWVGGYPLNPGNGMPYIRGLLVLTSPENGDTLAVLDGTYISDWRTGASAAVAVKYLARAGARRIVMVGAGSQGRTASVCIRQAAPGAELTVVDISQARLDSFQQMLAGEFGIKVQTTTDTAAAVSQADVVVLLTTANKPFIRKEWLQPGVLMLGMGSYQQAEDDALLSFDKIVVDSAGQAAHRGEIKNLVEQNKIPENSLAVDLGSIVAAKAVGRSSDQEKVLCVLVGLGAHDVSAAAKAFHKARSGGIGLAVQLNS
ncbi:MAG: ornithine cyclodeaminase family protein [Oligosphaeraceae bacterium]|nr:ornithine cyclodeaminase family protein [Oligosphaeraceae bacterium]